MIYCLPKSSRWNHDGMDDLFTLKITLKVMNIVMNSAPSQIMQPIAIEWLKWVELRACFWESKRNHYNMCIYDLGVYVQVYT